MTATTTDLQSASISQLAHEISEDWAEPNYAAVPYLEAMYSLESIDDSYYQDSGLTIVSYFISNASTWRGETAKAIKAELRRRCR